MSKFRYIFFALAIFLFLAPLCCLAEREKVGLSVDQSIFSFNLYPGGQQEFSLRVKNIINEKQRVKINLKDFSIDDDNKTSFLADRNELYGMKDWIRSEGEDIWIMEGGEEKLVKFTLSVPEDVSVGSHYSAVLFNVLPEVDFENFQKPIVGGEIGTYIFLNVGGEISGAGAIRDFISPVVVDEKADFSVTFENQGNVHYIPHGEIKIKNIFNRKNFNGVLEKHFVFPGKKYTFNYEWEVPSAFGVYAAEAFFVDQAGRNLSEKRLLFGRAFLILAGVISVFVVAGVVVFRERKNPKTQE